MALPNPSMTFVPFDILTAQQMNQMVANDQSLAAGTGLNNGVLTNSKLSTTSGEIGGTWTSYTPTTTGWSATTTSVFKYYRIGKTYVVQFNISGTSNSSVTTFTLPAAARTGLNIDTPTGFGQDSGTAINANGTGRMSIDPSANANLVNVYSNMFLGAWTASGTKSVRGTITYEAS